MMYIILKIKKGRFRQKPWNCKLLSQYKWYPLNVHSIFLNMAALLPQDGYISPHIKIYELRTLLKTTYCHTIETEKFLCSLVLISLLLQKYCRL